MIRYLRMSAGLIALLAVVAAGAMFMGRDASGAQFFQPCGNAAPRSAQTDPDNKPGQADKNATANTADDIIGNFGIGLDVSTCAPFISTAIANQWNSGGLISFTPNGWGVAEDGDIPDGTKVGTFSSKAVLGLFDNGCNTPLPVNFDLFDGTINRSGPTVDEKPEGQADRLSTMGPASAPAAATKWPTYLNDVAEKAGMNLDQLIARFVGVNTTSVQGTTVVLQFLVFQPGATVSDQVLLDPRLGYPAVTVLQDPSSAASNVDPPSDFCAPLWTASTLSGSVGGVDFRKNPGNGAYDFVTYVAPAADADNDGIENGLDPCPISPNASGWNPRANFIPLGNNVGDRDGDGLPDECDPHPDAPSVGTAQTGISNSDEDGDGWQNRGDNCPLASNVLQEDADGDGIGDACDTGATDADGKPLDKDVPNGRHAPVCLVTTVQVGTGGSTYTADDINHMAPCDPTVTSLPTPTPVGQTPTPTLPPGATPKPTSTGGVCTGPNCVATGIGTLAPEGTSVPVWATMLAALGVTGVFIGLGLMGSRVFRRRD